MNSVVFSAANRGYQVSHITYAGPVSEIPTERRKNGSTHSFKMVTCMGPAYCYYRSEDAARKARSALGAKMYDVKPAAFRHLGETIDPLAVVYFSGVYQLKEPKDGFTHGYTVQMKNCDEKNARLVLRFKSEDAAKQGWKGMWLSINKANGVIEEKSPKPEAETEVVAVVKENDGLPF